MRVKPVVPGAVIRDPFTRIALPAEGGEVEDSSFWIRRLLAGEVVKVAPATAPAKRRQRGVTPPDTPADPEAA